MGGSRKRLLTSFVLSLITATALACTGGVSSSGVGFSSAGSGGVSSSSGVGGIGSAPAFPRDAQSGPYDEPSMPFVACSLVDDEEPESDAGDAGDDAGEDADAGDSSTPPPPSPGPFPCEEDLPPDDCLNEKVMVMYLPGYCDGTKCQFTRSTKDCPGGCFTQIDGGKRCNDGT